jgi:hypothetical protein
MSFSLKEMCEMVNVRYDRVLEANVRVNNEEDRYDRVLEANVRVNNEEEGL